MDWISEYELDDGLRGLREQIGDEMLRREREQDMNTNKETAK